MASPDDESVRTRNEAVEQKVKDPQRPRRFVRASQPASQPASRQPLIFSVCHPVAPAGRLGEMLQGLKKSCNKKVRRTGLGLPAESARTARPLDGAAIATAVRKEKKR